MCAGHPTILLADDDVDDQELLKEAIAAIEPDIIVQAFNNGLEVLNYLDDPGKAAPCLIILDYNMPFSALNVLEKIADNIQLKKIPKIVWSTSGSRLYQDQCLNTGALKYIIKPSDSCTLEKVATEMIDACCGPAN